MAAPMYGGTPQSQAQILPDEPEDTSEEITIEADDTTPVVDETPEPAETPEPVAADEDDDIPAPLRGKSPKELAKMYVEAQKVIGRQGAEVGEVRRLADSLIKQQLAEKARRDAQAALAPKAPADPNVDPDAEFFAKPRDAISKAISEHPDLKTLKEAAAQAVARERAAAAKAALTEFQTSYPDAGDTLADPAFREWVSASKVRQALFARAHKAYDLDAAHEVFGTWKQLKGAKTPAAPAPTKASVAAKKKAVSAAAVPTGNAGAGNEGAGKKIYRRADIMRLMENDPDRYEALSGEIQQAYAEGRVR